MKRLYRTIKKLGSTFFSLWQHFGFRVAWFSTIDIITYHFPATKTATLVKKNLHKSIKRYLLKHYHSSIEQFKAQYAKPLTQRPNDKVIWQCWWQGEEYLDGITKICVNSVSRHANGHEIVIITKRNYSDYVKISPSILEKVNDNTISLTCFSDYLRMCLLYQNGGLWIDTTVLITQDIPSYCFCDQVYSTKSRATDNTYASEYRWASWFFGGDKGNILFAFFCKMFDVYWAHETKLINYYLVDYIIAIGYDNVPEIRKLIDAIPHTNPHKHDLCSLLNTPYDENKKYFDILSSETYIHKLSRKITLHEKTSQGEPTIYKMIANQYSSKN